MHSNHENNTPSFSWSGFKKKRIYAWLAVKKQSKKIYRPGLKIDIKTKANGYTFRLFHCM